MSVEDQSFAAWFLAGVATIMSILATTIATLWKRNETRNANEIAELKRDSAELHVRAERCEDERAALRVDIARLETRLSIIEKSE